MTVNSFDALRLFAAILVVYGHAYPLTGLPSPTFAGNTVQSIGVKIFFVISGYLIVGSWRRDPHVGRYLWRRALRIMPALCVVIMLSALVLGPLLSALDWSTYFGNSRTWSYVVNNIVLRPQYDLPGVFGANTYPVAVNGSLWSLPAEVAMYAIGPLVCVAGALLFRSVRAGLVVATLILMGLSLWFVRVHPPSQVLVVYGTSVLSFLDVAPYFLLGAIYTVFRHAIEPKPLPALLGCAALALFQWPGVAMEVALFLLLPYIVLAAGTQASWLGTALHRHGDVSYGVYLYGFPVQQAVAMLLPATRGEPWLNFLLAMGPILVLATASWRFVEAPLLRFKPSSRSIDHSTTPGVAAP